MSKWRVEIDVAFDSEDDVIAFANLLEDLKDKVHVWDDNNPSIDTPTRLRYHECFHDESPPKPCGNYKLVNFSEPTKTEHRNTAGDKIEGSELTKTRSVR